MAGFRWLRLPPSRSRPFGVLYCLGDGETTRWNRSEFVGIIRDECIPDWAAEKLAELRQSQNAPAMGEMTM